MGLMGLVSVDSKVAVA